MSHDESPADRQENEIQALKAIFNEDLRDLRSPGNWKIWTPLDIVITLSPLQGSSGLQEVHAQVDLRIICSKNYPDVEPTISLERSRGMSHILLAELQNQLEVRSSKLKGEVMIFELAQHVQAFLHEHNKPGTKSFYEEMLNRQKQQEQLQREAKILEELKEREVMQIEILKRQEILRSEVKSRRDYGANNIESSGESTANIHNKKNSRKSFSSVNECGDEYTCELHRGTELIIFDSNNERKIQKGRCLSHCDRGCVIYSALDLNTGDLRAINEWKVETKDHYELSHYQNKVTSVEQEFVYLSKLRHINLVKYLNMKCLQEKNLLIIYILQEFIHGSNCNSLFIKENIPADIDMLRYIAIGVLNALDFLHRNNVVHKDLKDTCIFIDNNGIIKLSGYSLEVKLIELFTQTQNTESYSKKVDILKFGFFLLSLYKGFYVENSDTELPTSLPNDLQDFITNCLSKNEKRFNTTQLLQHQFVSTPIYRLSPKRTYKQIAPNPEIISPSQRSNSDIKLFSQNRAGGPSRIQNEFEVLQWLGKGAFGDVLKVKNKLDGGCYALKRIELNPKNKLLNRKITREVKLLSRLNHENVVRYYNSWIESAILDNDMEEGSSESTPHRENPQRVPKKIELSFGNDVELLAPPIRDVEWSVSYESKSKCHSQISTSSSSEDESSEDEDWMGFLPNHADSSDSDSIEFEKTANLGTDEVDSTINTENKSSSKTVSPVKNREIQFMYIQMEFCEKSTLRTAIDGGLHSDSDRVWRLFREIVEGLAHIHQQGMIHRDLKPVNIFLDSNDHVKIGDFGLATTNIIPKVPTDIISKNAPESGCEMSQDAGDGSLTGQVGTALYVAPELSSTSKAIYNQKVDIYSLGIILFEMFYSSLNTGMERIKVLSGLRLKEIVFPQDFLDQKYLKQRIVIMLLLDHDVSHRPTSQELLQSDHIPPPVLEECELRELVRHTLSNPQSKAYKYLIASCFGQALNYVEDITYDMSVPSTNKPVVSKSLQIFEFAKQAVMKVFKLHGGQCLSTPLLMPKSEYYKGIDSCVTLMTHSGSIISIPHDLRVPFARYVALNNITLMKRYSMERVYREKKTFGFHPREMCECAFDVVTPNPGTFMADAEILSIIYEVVNEFSVLKYKNFVIRLNHTALLKAILLHCGIPSEKHNDIYSILSDARDGNFTKFQIKTHLISLCLTDSEVLTLFRLIESEYPINKVSNNLKAITKRKGEASDLAKKGLSELTKIIENAEALGVKCNLVVALGMVYNVQLYSGLMFQFVCELKKKRRRGGLDVLAAGGRYDDMLSNFRSQMERSGMITRVSQSAVGISISLDKLVQALQEQKNETDEFTDFYVVICSLGRKPLLREKTKLLQDLRAAGIKCTLLESQSLEEIQEQCNELDVHHIIILKDTEQGMVRIHTREKDRFQDKRININEVTDYMQRLMKYRNDSSNESSYINPLISRSESRISTGDREHTTSNSGPSVTVNFITTEGGKVAAIARKRLENQILSNMESTFQRLSNKEQVVVLALQIESNVVRTLASYLDLESEAAVQKSMNFVIERHQRHKKYLDEVCNEIQDYLAEKSHPVFAFYSIQDSIFKMLL